jgi:hypothetical protein
MLLLCFSHEFILESVPSVYHDMYDIHLQLNHDYFMLIFDIADIPLIGRFSKPVRDLGASR